MRLIAAAEEVLLVRNLCVRLQTVRWLSPLLAGLMSRHRHK